ncbi:MAG: tetratricopeptide repeat protein, partial [Candidatus Omnitrophota bacterium]|nr:tetratricopeptide repeat protein [Candidatus Omnitrophota bacterium]
MDVPIFHSSMRNLTISLLLIAVLGFAVYANSLGGAFIWDDIAFIKDNAYIKDWSNAARIFTLDFSKRLTSGGGIKYNFYRPLHILTYMADYSLWGLRPEGYHFTNALFHTLAALALFWLIRALFGGTLLPLVTAALFVVHPIHTEAVAYIAGRADSMALLFMLLAFVFYVKGVPVIASPEGAKQSKKARLLQPLRGFAMTTILCYILALLSRENSAILPVLLLLYHYTFKKPCKFTRYAPILLITIFYLIFRISMSQNLLAGSGAGNPSISPERIPGFFAALTNYVRLLFLPLGLHMEYGDKLFAMTDPRVITGLVIFTTAIGIALIKRRADKIIFFSIAWFFIALLPSSNIYPIGAYMAEHWLYLPSIGFFLLLANGLVSLSLPRKSIRLRIPARLAAKPRAFAGMTLLIAFYSFLTIKQNNYWRELIPFYERTLAYSPDNPKIYNNLGAVYYRLGKNEESIDAYKKAIKLNPYYYETSYNLGAAYHALKMYDEAIEAYKKEIAINPALPKVYNNLGAVYFDIHQYEKSIEAYKKAISLDPKNACMYFNIGFAYCRIGKYAEAISAYNKSLSIDPSYVNAYNDLGTAYHL